MGETDVVNFHGRFVWYELITTDMEAAKTFYTKVMGWGALDASVPGRAYTLFTAGNVLVSGLMDLPEDARKMGGKPSWLGYVGVNDVDAAADRIKHLGGAVHVPPTDVPNISRFSIFADPQTARLALFKWLKPGQEQPAELDATGPRRLARVARRRLGKGVGFLRRAFWLAKSGRRYRRDGHVSAVLRRRADDRRHAHQAPDDPGSPFGFIISTSATSMRRRSA